MLIILLFVIFFLKHFMADYPLQTPYMLRKTHKIGWKLPLLTHSLVHAVLTFAILILFTSLGMAIALAIMELILHFIIDYWKAQRCKYAISDAKFWIALGFDQLLHYLTYALIILIII
ncbi:hypothetical protein bas27_0064 [Escherichia phage TrudiGerster]|uniref:DUF3307 domain-containing protein n=1 Tax=Escherichia phage TrudiGerster TaxID=2851991 RepID=A0AAE7VZP3_9CAUD|nr:hypothetical protein bas27_0064 [Escherichia phage TrudiGerster]